MKLLQTLVGIMAFIFASPHAFGLGTGFIELEILVFGTNQAQTDAGSVTVRCVFDTSVAPIVLTNALRWQSASTTVLSSQGSLSVVPFQAGESETGLLYEFGNGEVVTADLTYFTVSNRYRLFVVAGGQSMVFDVLNALPVFNPAMTSLPDNPTQYQSAPGDPGYEVSISSPAFTAAWPERPTDTGIFAYKVTIVPAPDAEPCVADVTGDGLIDFLDISAFLQSFNEGCP